MRAVFISALCATCAALTFGVSSAQAFVSFSGDPTLDPTAFWNTFTSPSSTYAYEQSIPGQVLSGADEAAAADVVAGTAGLGALGPLALVAGGVLVVDAVWKSGLGNELGNWLANTGLPATNSGISSERWCPVLVSTYSGNFGANQSAIASGVSTCNSTPVAYGYSIPDTPAFPYWALAFTGTGSCSNIFGGGAGSPSTALIINSGALIGGNVTITTCAAELSGLLGSYGISTLHTYSNATCMLSTGCSGSCTGGTCGTCANEGTVDVSVGSTGNPTGYTGSCMVIVATETQMVQMLGGTQLQPCGGTGQLTCPTAPGFTIGTSTGMGGGGTSKICTACLNKVDGSIAQSSEGNVNCFLKGNGCSANTATFTLPRPQITETYDAYISRLRNLGYWGFIYEVDDDMSYPAGSPALQLQPKEITEISVTTSAPATTLIPNYWAIPGHGLGPSAENADPTKQGKRAEWNGPQVNPTKTNTIEIEKVPNSYSPTGTGFGGGGPCNCPGIDFTPLTGLSYGSSFPFGAFTWLNGVTSSFSGAGSGTPVSFTLPLGSTTQTVTLSSSEWETTYRPIVFPIIEFLLTLSAVLWFALRVIGHPSGDDGDME